MIEQKGGTTFELRQELMIKAFEHTAAFDTRVAQSFKLRLPKKGTGSATKHPTTW
jgi:AICAR transformylase/IMP cyclohydrolase PurH